MNKDFLKYRVYDTIGHKYVDECEIEFLLHNDGNLLFGNWHGDIKFAETQYVVERCTGLKDKHGNLIYENDIVEHKDNGGLYDVCWSESECGWAIRHRASRMMRAMNCFDGDELKIFSNIHDAMLA